MIKTCILICLSATILFLSSGDVWANSPQSQDAVKSTPDKTSTTKKAPIPPPKLNTTFKKNTVKNADNPVICKKRNRENSRIRREKKCMTKKQWEKEQYRAKRQISGRL